MIFGALIKHNQSILEHGFHCVKFGDAEFTKGQGAISDKTIQHLAPHFYGNPDPCVEIKSRSLY
jgi:hypothetical protein